MNPQKILNVILCLGFLLGGCVSSNIGNSSDNEPTYTQVIQTTPTNMSAFLPPTATSTPTLSPIPTLYQTPLPLSDEAAADYLLELYETNGGCGLPCWWGITAGETSLHDAFDILLSIGQIIDDTYIYEGERIYHIVVNFSQIFNEDKYVSIYLRSPINASDPYFGIVTGVSIWDPLAKPYHEYALADYLGLFGVPDEVYVSVFRNLVFFDIFYVEEGISVGNQQIRNELMSENPDESKFVACPQSPLKDIWHLDVRNPETAILEDMIAGARNGFLYASVEDATELTIHDFYEIYLDPDTDYCIEGEVVIGAED